MRRTTAFEQLDARCLMAGDTGAMANTAAAAVKETPPAEIGSLVAGVQIELSKSSAAAKGADPNAAQALRDYAGNLPSADLIDGLRQLQDLDAIRGYAHGVFDVLYGAEEEGVDGLTKAGDLLGGPSDRPEAPWTPTVRDPAAIIAALLGGHAGAGRQTGGRLATHFQRMREARGGESGSDGFERVGWAGDDYHYEYRSRDGLHSVEYHKTPQGVDLSFRHLAPGGGVTGGLRIDSAGEDSSITVRGPGGSITVMTSSSSGGTYTRTEIIDREGNVMVIEVYGEPEAGNEQERGEDDGGNSQPSPTDDGSSWFSPLHPDAWATYLAWYTHQSGPDTYDPRDCVDGEGTAAAGSSDGAPRVGPDAVINPGDAGFITATPGGSGGTTHDPSCPIPIGPDRPWGF
jgi:hypothetical protein